MTESNIPTPNESSASAGLSVDPRWEKPLVASGGGRATLLLRVVPPSRDEGARRAPLDVAFALDRSGSMSGDKLRLVKEAVDVAVTLLREEDRVALVVYDSTVQTLHPLAAATPKTKTALRLALHGVDAGGSTALADGWLTACRQLAEAPAPMPQPLAAGPAGRSVRRALLLTDGLANVGLTDPVALTEHADQLRRRGIGTTTLGVGLDFDEELLAGLAEAGGGNFQWIGHAEELRAFFSREIGELLSIAAGALTLTLDLPPALQARVISAYPTERHGDRLVVALGDLPAGEEIPLLIACEAAPGQPGTIQTITGELTWADPAADLRRHLPLVIPPLAYADPATVEATAGDPLVREQIALQETAAAHREAVRLDRAGRYLESRQMLESAGMMLAAAPETDAVRGLRAQHHEISSAAPNAPLSEETRKRATWAAHRTARGRRQSE